jgi:stage II sporulation protein AA (anti-sigma F factor antagonist)
VELTVLSRDGDALRLQASGRITQDDVSQTTDPMVDLLGPEGFAGQVVLSLAEVDFIDSSGIGWLVARHKDFNRAEGKLVIHSVEPTVMEILKMLRFHQVLHVAKNERAALAAVRRK